jgi:NAD(P)-dependent dehydrogenase (short-subunit alcohol dehydrogenase family)
MELQNRVALITGGSAGIGLAVARKLVAAGARVALCARSRVNLDRAVAELGPSHAVAFPLDVTDRAALAMLPAAVVARLGGLDILINNAGCNCRGAVQDRKPEELVSILETNLVAPVLLTRVALDHLRSGGAIINVASIAGKIPVPHEATYSASKFGLRAFSRALAVDLRPRGIRVSCVCPGPVDTEFFGDLATVPDLVFSQPMSSAEEVAAVILRCLHSDPAPLEADIPVSSGALAQLGYLFPAMADLLRPGLEKKGAKAKAEYQRRKQAR